MAKNKTSYAIRYFLLHSGMSRDELAKRLAMTRQVFSKRITHDSFTEFEREQLQALGVDLQSIVK
jgi:hypothetical protein